MSLLSNANLGRINKIRNWLDSRLITNYKIDPKTFEIDVYESVFLYDMILDDVDDDELLWTDAPKISKLDDKLPEYIQFRNIYGSFDISSNNLVSLRGCPYMVQGCFDCSNNRLNSLEGFPKNIGHFICNFNYKKFNLKDILDICKVKELTRCVI